MKLPPPAHLAIGALTLAAVISFAAWQVQAAADRHLTAAHALQRVDPGASDMEPPQVEDYEQILETLDRSIAIRREIDSRLGEVEAIIASLRASQQEADDIAERSRMELDRIAALLGSALDASAASVGNLEKLSDELSTSARLARLIAQELEELDRSMGPSAGGRP